MKRNDTKNYNNDVITANYDLIFRFANFIVLSVFWKPGSGRITHKPLSFTVLYLLSRYLSTMKNLTEIPYAELVFLLMFWSSEKYFISKYFRILFYQEAFIHFIKKKQKKLLKHFFSFIFSSRFLWDLMFNFAQCVLNIPNIFQGIKKLPIIVLLGSYLVSWLFQNNQAKPNGLENIASCKSNFGR